MKIFLRANERIFINGAVLRVDRKVAIEFLNDVTFLLESHVMQAEQATTPLRQIYFAIQMTLMDPGAFAHARTSIYSMLDEALRSETEPRRRGSLQDICVLMESGRSFDALRISRELYRSEQVRVESEKPKDRESMSQCN